MYISHYLDPMRHHLTSHRAALLIAACSLIVPLGTRAVAQPRLVILGGETHDWGRVPPGELHGEIRIVNPGDRVLRLAVESTCGCTLAPLDKDSLPPGDTATLAVALDLREHAGEQRRSVIIRSNDPARPEMSLRLTAFILSDLLFSPSSFGWKSDAVVGREYDVSVEMTNAGDHPLTIVPPATIDDDSLAIRFDLPGAHQLHPGGRLRLRALVTPRRAGLLWRALRLRVPGGYREEIVLTLVCVARPSVSPTPDLPRDR
jgi:hypothetical protein